MDMMTSIKNIKKKQIEPVYFLQGTETFLMEQFVKELEAQLLTADEAEMNHTHYRLVDTPLSQIVEDAETFPFFAGKRIVVVHDFYLVTSQKVQTKVEHDPSVLEQYLKAPAQETVLVLIAPYEKLDERKKLSKQLKEATFVSLAPFDERQASVWIDEQAGTCGVSIEPEAKQALLYRAGVHLFMLSHEIKKCALYVGEGEAITIGVVKELVAETVEQTVFDVIDHAAKGRVGQAVAMYHQLLKQKEEPLAILALLTRQFRIYFQVKNRLGRGYTQKEIATQLKLHPYVVKLASQQVGRFSNEMLQGALVLAADTDYGIKTGKWEKVLAVELMLMKLGQMGK
ncbi:DNA polymerase III subunit delta [Shouchella shacheensis]|uniref:DNA polymerase III subunit delta n=1 Tax=Shouchella shacheensis TaxID=1649580 RepID=UPI00073FE2DF|nr:DNA polymerase III subunit delta [Shouchella shacheensis]